MTLVTLLWALPAVDAAPGVPKTTGPLTPWSAKNGEAKSLPPASSTGAGGPWLDWVPAPGWGKVETFGQPGDGGPTPDAPAGADASPASDASAVAGDPPSDPPPDPPAATEPAAAEPPAPVEHAMAAPPSPSPAADEVDGIQIETLQLDEPPTPTSEPATPPSAAAQPPPAGSEGPKPAKKSRSSTSGHGTHAGHTVKEHKDHKRIGGPGGDRKGFQSAVSCAKCHDDIYDQWNVSMHAQSWSDKVFQAAYKTAIKDTNGRARELCLKCHAPVAFLTGDTKVRSQVSKEGITCDLCHSISAVSQTFYTPTHFFTNPGVQRGAMRDSEAPHPTAYSELYKQSLYCAACHQAKLHEGDDYFTFDTYKEWERSPYNRLSGDLREAYARPEITTKCQDCHMKTYSGEAAKKGPYRSDLHDHFMPGGNSPTMVGTAVSFFLSVLPSPDRKNYKVTTQVQNRAAGHMVPADLPDRRLKVLVEGFDENGNVVFTDQRWYGKVLRDRQGRTPARFWNAAGVANDNRIAPGEIRTEHFNFYAPSRASRIRAQLLYYLFDPALSSAYGFEPEPIVVDEREEDLGG